MNFDIVELKAGDVVMTTLDIGNIPSNEVDAYVNKVMPTLKSIFGCQIAILPIRGGELDFTIIRNPLRKPEVENQTPKKKLKTVCVGPWPCKLKKS